MMLGYTLARRDAIIDVRREEGQGGLSNAPQPPNELRERSSK